MACRNHDAADGVLCFDSEGNGRRRRRVWSQYHLKAIAREHTGSAPGKFIGQKPAVITNDHFLFRGWDRKGAPEIGCRLGYAFHVGESEVLRNHGPPAIGSKFNR